MSTTSPSPQWRPLPPSPVIDVLHEDEDIEDVVALSGGTAPEWLRRLSIPTNWQRIRRPDAPEQASARMALFGPLGKGEWEAADIINVTGYTGWPVFIDVYRGANGVLRALDSAETAVKALPVPPIRWTAAVRSSGITVLGNRTVWIQQSTYVAGSEQPHAGRLIEHTILVDPARREQLAESITRSSDDVYRGFINTLPKDCDVR